MIREIRAKFGVYNSHQFSDIGENSDGYISDFWLSGQSIIKENCHTSRTSNDIDIILEPVSKLDKRNTTTSKKLAMTSCRQIVTSLSFFQFMTNLEQSGSRILDAWSVKLTFSLMVTFYITKTENRTEN